MPAGAPAEQRRRLRRVRRQRRHEPVEAPQRLLGVRGAERRQRACGVRGLGSGVRVSKISKISKILQLIFFANFWRACSRLYQNEILQENMRLTFNFDSISQALQDLLVSAPLQSQNFRKKSV